MKGKCAIMQKEQHMKNILILIICSLLPFAASAQDSIGSIKRYTGSVELYDGVSPRPAMVSKPDTEIALKNKVATKRASAAVIELDSGDKVALSENSMATFSSTNKINPESGKVVFSIKKRGSVTGTVAVGLKTAVIGVKGTQFLVDMSQDGKCKVYLKEGEITVDALEGEFIKHGKVVMDEYEAYVKKMMGEYDSYVAELQKQYTEYVKSFTMKAGQAVSIDGNDVETVDFDSGAMREFDLLNM